MMHKIIGVMETAEYQPWCGVSASAGLGPDHSVVPMQALMWRVPSGRYQDITGTAAIHHQTRHGIWTAAVRSVCSHQRKYLVMEV